MSLQKLASILPILQQLQGVQGGETQNEALRQKMSHADQMLPGEMDRTSSEARFGNARAAGLEFENNNADEILKAKLMESMMHGVGSFGQGLAMTLPQEEASDAFRNFAVQRGLMTVDPDAHLKKMAAKFYGGDLEQARAAIQAMSNK